MRNWMRGCYILFLLVALPIILIAEEIYFENQFQNIDSSLKTSVMVEEK